MSEQDTVGRTPPLSVSVLGLGDMGSALARAFVAKRHAVTVWNRTPAKALPLAEAGAKVAGSVAEAVAASDVTVVCVLGYTTCKALLHTEELADRLKGKTLVQLTTGTPQEARDGAAWATQHGVAYVDGAIMNYPKWVGTPECTILYAGSKQVFDSLTSLLRSLAGSTLFVGEDPGYASTLDSGLLSFYYATSLGFLHGAALCESEGIPIETYLATLLPFLSGFVSDTLKVGTEMVSRRTYAGSEASLNVNAATLGHVIQLSDENGVDRALPVCLSAYLKKAVAAGYAEDELPAVFEMFRKRGGGGNEG